MSTIVVFDGVASEAASLASAVMKHPVASQYDIFTAISVDQLEELAKQDIQVSLFIVTIAADSDQPNGIEVVKRLATTGLVGSRTQVIYVGDCVESVLDAYETPHVYFLLKPVDPVKLTAALDRAFENLGGDARGALSLQTGRRNCLVDVASIYYVESYLRKAVVHSSQGDVESYIKLDDVQSQLPDSFVRCHRSYLVNMAYVNSMQDGELVLANQERVPVSQRRAKETHRALLRYMKARGIQGMQFLA